MASRQAAFLEALVRTAGAEIVPPQLFFKQLVPVDDPDAAFDVRF